jgi:hypothetical protein
MDDDDMKMYPDTDAEPSGENDPKGEEDGGEEGETTLIPGSMFPDGMPEPGEKCTFEVVHAYGDQCEVRYCKDDDGGDKPKSEMDAADEKLGEMAT